MGTLGMVSGFVIALLGSLFLLAWAITYGFLHFEGVSSERFDPMQDRWSVFLGFPAFSLALVVIGLRWMVEG